MANEGRTGGQFDIGDFADRLEAKVASWYEAAYLSAEYCFKFSFSTDLTHPKYIGHSFLLSYIGKMWESDPVPSQRHFLIGTVNFWDITNYTENCQEQRQYLPPPPAATGHADNGTYLGKINPEGKIFLANKEDIYTVIANALAFVREFEAKEKSISIRDLQFFTGLTRVRICGHLIEFAGQFDVVPPVYRSPSESLQSCRERIEEIVRHVKPTVKHTPI